MLKKVSYCGHVLWLVNDAIEGSKFVIHKLRARGHSLAAARRWMREAEPVPARELKVPLEAMCWRGRVLGFKVRTWIGARYAKRAGIRAFLRREGYTAGEIASLCVLAKRIPVAHPAPVRARMLYGVRA